MPVTDLSLLESVAREAGEIARSYWREDPQVWDKGTNDPVSEADLAVDKHLKARLLSARPDYAWVSEETEDDPARFETERVFICDPIDGTRAFVAGEPTWAHSLAVVERGVVTSAAVFLPIRNKMYLAAKNHGATLNDAKIHASKNSNLESSVILSPKAYLEPQHWKEGCAPRVKRSFRPSLAYRLSLIAEGRYDAMLTLRSCWEWDIAAGSLIASEAGADVSDRQGRPLTFNSLERQTDGVIAGGADIQSQIIDRLAA